MKDLSKIQAKDLKASEERFRLLVDSVKDYAILMLSPEGTIATWNEGARRLLGYDASEIIGQNFTCFYSEDDIAKGKPQQEIEVAKSTGRFEDEGRRIRKDGTSFIANVVLTSILDSHGKLQGFAKVTRDISERKAAENSLRESEERSRLMIEVVKDYAIFMLDPQGNVKTWNEGAKRFKGYEAKEIIGKHFSVFYTEDDIKNKKVEYEIRTALSTGRVEDEGWRVRKDGTRFWANVVITRVNDEKGNILGFAKVTRDLTERKKMEDELVEARDQLEKRVELRTQQLQEAVTARDEFISVASHELKTPLTSLKLQAQITKRSLAKGDTSLLTAESMTQFADHLDRQVDKLRQLVEDMLDVSRIQRGTLSLRPELSNISTLVLDVAAQATTEIQKSGSVLDISVEPDIYGTCDKYRIEQVVINLLSNALKYGSGNPIKVRLHKENNQIVLVVKDSGIGIKEEDQKRIFERFERAISASEVSGLGLGLFITKEILKSHQGSIEVKSQIGKGSEFVVTFPVSPVFENEQKAIKDYEF